MTPVTPTLRQAFEHLPLLRARPPAYGYPQDLMHLFAPVDRVHEAITGLCSSAQVSVAAAMYGWDDDEIDALFRAKLEDERVPVTLALDKSQAGGVHEKAILAKWKPELIGNVVVIGTSSVAHAISHDKMVVLDGQVTICGSTNFSESGQSKQNNECTVVWDAAFAAEARARIDVVADFMRSQMAATPIPSAG